MSAFDRLVTAVTDHSKAAIAIMVLLTVVVGAGAPMVEQSSSLSQFQSDTTESQKLDYIQNNFQTGDQNTTTVQIIMRGDDVLAKDQLVESIDLQQTLRENETIAPSLVNESPTSGVANVVAITAIRQEEAAELEQRRQTLNETAATLRGALTDLRQNPNASIEAAFSDVRASTTVDLNDTDYATFETAAQQLRNASGEQAVQEAYTLGTQGVLAADYAALQEDADALQNAGTPTLAEQRDQLESMEASEVESLVTSVLQNGNGGSGGGVLALMPTGYESGPAEATMIIVTQTTDSDTEMGSASDRLVETQTAMQDIATSRSNGNTYMVFGGGIIADEITQSMTDSVLIVGPLALIFVLITLIIAYRDLLDIALGLLGILAVLVWTFGFMGWADISFNQIFIAVPVLLIGLSIDYAIHIFMRHREEREAVEEGPRGSMRVALAGVGIALVWVTATTVIGFLSNLVSPLPPIQDFGIVSSVGITAALLVFGVLIPALKVELDEFLESRGFDRKKRAFGTGGGRLGKALTVGSTAAKKSPWLVILFAVLLSAGGAYGATQVDTSFSQTDFIAEDPPAWMEDLPEPFAPHDYTAKENLQYVNDNFLRQDSQAQILIEGEVSSDNALERLHDAQEAAGEKGVTVTLSGGEAAITSPLTVMEEVAAQNETFNETYTAADTDGNGVPDENVSGVYDALFAVAPDQAGGVIAHEGDDYEALRMVVSIQGGASGNDVTEQMRAVAAVADGGGLTATATGQSILFKIIQDQLLDTVIESLIVTLIAIVVFLMAAYRLTEGSATLGLVTLLPVVFSVAWILGTMYLAGIPFNVLTGMITSLTVGLGVAYSIHLSERYNQELERRGDAFDALAVALKGTGGALLGSAATTVGGFGVLVFAVLPPLQQFGIITGMTIIYAFLAAVLVLPSLLVVWTRYTNPLGGGEFDDGNGGSGSGSDGTGAVDVGEGATDAPTREASPRFVQPGGEATVVVHLPEVAGRAVLREDAPVDSLDHVDPDALSTTVTDGTLYAVWETEAATPARVEYTVSVPGDAQDNETVRFDGELRTARGATSVEGDGFVTVVSDVFERIVSEGEVSRQDLALAAQQLEAGALSPEQYERIHEQWLNQDE
ncbi:MMPL family transporter [Salarchaeum japonicum]|uniref:SSD domain-containing protein n=1 Tax=Salarchaeum japonicum TaxID=555573 RepID=A0AAV3T473_9EURY|nr:MMPL family transporter [Salarchaeum japonicum]